MMLQPPLLTLFPYTTLFRSRPWLNYYDVGVPFEVNFPSYYAPDMLRATANNHPKKNAMWFFGTTTTFWELDRKSTRLNSSHVKISYAVFCLKKKRNSRKNCQ